MDRHLRKLALLNRCYYTRYADDITISSGQREFPKEIASIRVKNGKLEHRLGNSLLGTISNNGFNINHSKIRLQRSNERQMVTGLVANKKVNVTRKFIRNVRAMLHNWRQKGVYACQKEFEARTGTKKLFRDTVRGKIEFIGTVRGKDDTLYLKLLQKLATLDGDLLSTATHQYLQQIHDRSDFTLSQLRVIEYTKLDGSDCDQGTGFFVENIGLVTCRHVVPPDSYYEVFKRDESDRQFGKVDIWDDNLDLAILWVREFPEYEFEYSLDFPAQGDSVYLAGFPHWAPGNSGIVESGLVIGTKETPYGKRFLINAGIRPGNSGGPVFDKNWNVIGVAAKGADDKATNFFEVIPFADVVALKAR
jgi:S1-C subfamily serine protease